MRNTAQVLQIIEKLQDIVNDELMGSIKYDNNLYKIGITYRTRDDRVESLCYRGPVSTIKIRIDESSYSRRLYYEFTVHTESYSVENWIELPNHFKFLYVIWRRWRELCSRLEKRKKNKDKIDDLIKHKKEQQQFNEMIHRAFPDEIDGIILGKDKDLDV